MTISLRSRRRPRRPTQALTAYRQVLPDEDGQRTHLIPISRSSIPAFATLDDVAGCRGFGIGYKYYGACIACRERSAKSAGYDDGHAKDSGCRLCAGGAFTSARLPQIDFNSLDAVLSTDGAVAALDELNEKVELAMRSQLPSVVTAADGAAVQAGIDYTASSLANLRFGVLDGLTSVQLGTGGADLAGTVDIALDALLSAESAPSGVSVLYHTIPVIGQSLAI